MYIPKYDEQVYCGQKQVAKWTAKMMPKKLHKMELKNNLEKFQIS